MIKGKLYVMLYVSCSVQTRVCNECRTCVCGGSGERIQIDSPCCFGCCLRSSFPCPCLPICCPSIYFPCAKRHTLFVDDAQMAMHEIKKAMDDVKAVHATVRNSSTRPRNDTDGRRSPSPVRAVEIEDRGRSRSRSRSRSPNRL